MTVRIVVGDHHDVANVRNVAIGGLRIDAAFEAETGDPVSIQIRDRRFAGRIVWLSDTSTGIAFDTPLRHADLALFTGRPDRSLTPARARVGFAGHAAIRR